MLAMAVYCPVCEAPVEAVAKVCLSCHNDLTINGPITATGHDVRQLKAVIRARDDLSMARKFHLIAEVEEGADPVALGITASGDETASEPVGPEAVVIGGMTLVDPSTVDIPPDIMHAAIQAGFAAANRVQEVAVGNAEGNAELMAQIPVLRPPHKSFCPKCGSDILSHTQLQWKKWKDQSAEVVSLEIDAALQQALAQLQAIHEVQLRHAVGEAVANATPDQEALRAEIEAELRPRLEQQIRASLEAKSGPTGGGTVAVKQAPAPAEPKPASALQKETSRPQKAASGGPQLSAAQKLFGGKKGPKKTFEGDPADKPEWFLKEALDTVYDPHGTSRTLTPRTILARSAEGNVRVQDTVRIYAAEGSDALSELAWTSPFTKYIIEAYDAT